jgi:DNA-binding MarR family transcriptional regulator
MRSQAVPGPDPDPSTTTLLRTAYNLLSAAIYRGVAQTGASDLRPAHGNAMEMLAIQDGLRLTDIAARAGMAPQSMGELVDDLVSKGYLERHEDPADRRAKRIYLTGKGRATAAASKAAMRQVEEQISQLLGARQYQQMRRDLAAIAGLDLRSPPAETLVLPAAAPSRRHTREP